MYSWTKKSWRFINLNASLFLGVITLTSFVTTFATIALTEKWKLTLLENEANITVNTILSITTPELESRNRTLSKTKNSNKEAVFFELGDTKVTNHNYSYFLKGDRICEQNNPPFLLILVHSVAGNVKRRDAIRNTWGSSIKGKWLKANVSKTPVKLVFLFGVGRSTDGLKDLHTENLLHGDIVQGDFVDTYYNLTRKTIMGIHWASKNCPSAKYIFKTDDDMFVHILNLIRLLQNETKSTTNMIYGYTRVNTDVIRTGHWAVSNKTYPFSKYPTYASGASYVIPGHIAGEIYRISEYMSYLNIEDVFVTGIVRTMIGVGITHVVGFTGDYEERPKPCKFHNDIKISATNVNEDLMYEIWSGLDQPIKNCFDKKKKEV